MVAVPSVTLVPYAAADDVMAPLAMVTERSVPVSDTENMAPSVAPLAERPTILLPSAGVPVPTIAATVAVPMLVGVTKIKFHPFAFWSYFIMESRITSFELLKADDSLVLQVQDMVRRDVAAISTNIVRAAIY